MLKIGSNPAPKMADDGASPEEPRGQAIVLVVFALFALIAITGLAIDGGRLYQGRRQVQNAADAAALAGTRLLASERCSPSGGLDADVWAEVLTYAQHNEVSNDHTGGSVAAWYVSKDETRLGEVGTIGTVPNGTTGVEVSTMITEPTTFMRITGQNHMAAAASSMAMFGPISGGGVLPIAFPVDRVHYIMGGGESPFKIFDGSGAICREDDVHCPDDPNPESQRGWLNLGYIFNDTLDPDPRPKTRGGGAAEATYYVTNSYPYPLYLGTEKVWKDANDGYTYYKDGDYILGETGTQNSVRDAVCDAYAGEDVVVFLPVFDYTYEGSMMTTVFPGDAGVFNNNDLYFHLVGIMAAKITSCGSASEKTISGEFVEYLSGQGPISPGAGVQSGGGACSPYVQAVILWK